jgi:hypothetical protein
VFGGRPKVAQAAMEQLLKGPSARERAGGLSTAIPAGTKLRGVTITNGVATVDLSGGFGDDAGLLGAQLRLGQVVYTLTQFPGVTGVVFALDGKRVDYFTGDGLDISKPQTRAGYEDLLPAVVIESVHDGQSVRSPLRVAGTANVFEAVFDLDVVDANGKVLVTKRVMATSGTGARGRFDVTLRFEAPSGGSGKVVAWYSSPKDGTRVVADEIAVDFER